MTEPDPAVEHGKHPADLIAERALACPSVAALASGLAGQAATYLPGRRVAGVSLSDQVCEVAVVLRLDGRPLPELAEEVRQALEPVAGGRAVDIVITDVVAGEPSALPPGAQ